MNFCKNHSYEKSTVQEVIECNDCNGLVISEDYGIPRVCEKCSTLVYYLKGGKRKTYINWQEGSKQIGMSKKYPGEFGGYCKKHIDN